MCIYTSVYINYVSMLYTCIYICIHMYVYMYLYMYIFTYAYIIHTYIYIYMYVYISIYLQMGWLRLLGGIQTGLEHVYAFLCVQICIRACACVSVCVCGHIHEHARIHVCYVFTTTNRKIRREIHRGWWRCMGCLQLQVSSRKRAANSMALLRKLIW